jgi:hypothetical protein
MADIIERFNEYRSRMNENFDEQQIRSKSFGLELTTLSCIRC